MDRPNSRHLAVPQAAPPSQLRHKPSLRERFWARTSANHDGQDDVAVVQEPQPTPSKKAAYVPMNAAAGFSRTVATAAPREREPFRTRRPPSEPRSRSSTESSSLSPYARSPRADLATGGHLYVHAEAEPDDATDYADFIAAAQSEERLRRAASSQRQGNSNSAHARSHYRDSGYYSSSNGGHHEPSLPSAASAAAGHQTRLKTQPSMKAFGQRIAAYIKPPRDEPVSSVRR